jgi:uncharacterized protein HemX
MEIPMLAEIALGMSVASGVGGYMAGQANARALEQQASAVQKSNALNEALEAEKRAAEVSHIFKNVVKED